MIFNSLESHFIALFFFSDFENIILVSSYCFYKVDNIR